MTNELRTREFHEARNKLATLPGGAGLAVGWGRSRAEQRRHDRQLQPSLQLPSHTHTHSSLKRASNDSRLNLLHLPEKANGIVSSTAVFISRTFAGQAEK